MPGTIDALPQSGTVAGAGVPPLVAHVIFHLGVGGLENGLVNLINHMPPDRYRHAIICLKGYSDFHARIRRRGVEIIALNKQEGHDIGLYLRLFRTLRRLRPDIVHTRNLSAVEGQLVAALAGVRLRAHGEHGRDISDLDGTNVKYRLLRKAMRPLVGQFTTVSKDLESWLVDAIGAHGDRVTQVYNGVDSDRFHPRHGPARIGPPGFMDEHSLLIGSAGRMAAVKDFPNLVRAFLMLAERIPDGRRRLRLAIVGEGESRDTCLQLLREAGAESLAWLPGKRDDVDAMLRAMDVFVLPSLAEGISNVILEAMASGLPVVATRVGGNGELVVDGTTGFLVPAARPTALASALYQYCADPALRARHGAAARQRVEERFSIESMASAYMSVYDGLLRRRAGNRNFEGE